MPQPQPNATRTSTHQRPSRSQPPSSALRLAYHHHSPIPPTHGQIIKPRTRVGGEGRTAATDDDVEVCRSLGHQGSSQTSLKLYEVCILGISPCTELWAR